MRGVFPMTSDGSWPVSVLNALLAYMIFPLAVASVTKIESKLFAERIFSNVRLVSVLLIDFSIEDFTVYLLISVFRTPVYALYAYWDHYLWDID